MDKQQIAQDILSKYNLSPNSASYGDIKSTQSSGADRAAQIRAIASGTTPEQIKEGRGLGEKILDFTGGKEIAQGLGAGLAMRGNIKRIEETQAQQLEDSNRIIARLREARAAGEDTTELENLLRQQTESIRQFAGEVDSILNPDQLTGRQVVGDALQLGTTLASIGQFSGVGTQAKAGLGAIKSGQGVGGTLRAVKGATQATSKLPTSISSLTGAQSIGQGALQGAKTGAISGTGFGALTGLSQGLQGEGDVGDVLKQTAGGAITGGVGGAIVGGILGGVTGAIKGRSIAKQSGATADDVIDAITPDAPEIGSKEYAEMLKRGQITPKTATSPAKINISDQSKATAVKYKDLITKDPVQTGLNLREQIAQEDKLVGEFLESNNGIFNTGELKNRINASLDDVVDLTVDEKQLARAKAKFTDAFLKDLKKNDMVSLWKHRKAYDSQIDKIFGKTNPTLNDQVKRSVRNSVQDFIAERTRDEVYKNSMSQMSQLFDLVDIVDNKAIKQKNYSAINMWVKKNPSKAKAIGAVVTGLGVAKAADILGINPFD